MGTPTRAQRAARRRWSNQKEKEMRDEQYALQHEPLTSQSPEQDSVAGAAHDQPFPTDQDTMSNLDAYEDFHLYYQNTMSQRAELDAEVVRLMKQHASKERLDSQKYLDAWRVFIQASGRLAYLARLRARAKLRRITELRKSLPLELSSIIFRYVLDERVPEEFIIQERPSTQDSNSVRWVRGLDKVPEELMVDGWFFDRCGKLVFDHYYATIQIDLSAKYPNWKDWVKEWVDFSGAIKRVLLVFDGFDEVNILSLAEVAYFFAESSMITRTHNQPLVLAQNRSGLGGGGPSKAQILVKVVRGDRGDWDEHMFELIDKMVAIGSQHRAGNRLSREGIRKRVFDWVMGEDDFDIPIAQILGRRMVDADKFPPRTGVSYARWIHAQPRSSPLKRKTVDMLKNVSGC